MTYTQKYFTSGVFCAFVTAFLAVPSFVFKGILLSSILVLLSLFSSVYCGWCLGRRHEKYIKGEDNEK